MTETRGFCTSFLADELSKAALACSDDLVRPVAIEPRRIWRKLTAQQGRRQSRAPFTTKPRQIGRLQKPLR